MLTVSAKTAAIDGATAAALPAVAPRPAQERMMLFCEWHVPHVIVSVEAGVPLQPAAVYLSLVIPVEVLVSFSHLSPLGLQAPYSCPICIAVSVPLQLAAEKVVTERADIPAGEAPQVVFL